MLSGLAVTSQAAPPQLDDADDADEALSPDAEPSKAEADVAEGLVTHGSGTFFPVLERSSSSLSSADLLFMGELNRRAMCFGGGSGAPAVSFDRKFGSMPTLRTPLLRTWSSASNVHCNAQQTDEVIARTGGGPRVVHAESHPNLIWRSLGSESA